MATTYLSSASGAVPVSSENLSREHHHPHYHHSAAAAAAHGLHHPSASDLGVAGSHLSGVMNLVNSAAAVAHAGGYGGNAASSGGGSGRDSISSSSSMHEMKYLPPSFLMFRESG